MLGYCISLAERLEEITRDLHGPPGLPGTGVPGKPGPQGIQGIPGMCLRLFFQYIADALVT